MATKQKLDQYYTPETYALECVSNLLKVTGIDTSFVEPSAGTGVFIEALKQQGVEPDQIAAFDLDPKHSSVTQQDFLKTRGITSKVAVGNPPFGKGGSLAIKFMNHLVQLGVDYIGFINPACIGVKHSTLKQLDKRLHLVEEFPMPEDLHFVYEDGSPYREGDNAVRCYFQIWKVEDFERDDPTSTYECDDFKDMRISTQKYKDEEGRAREIPQTGLDADFVVISHGPRVGEVLDYEDGIYKANVTRFIKVKDGKDVNVVRENFKNLDLTKFTSRSTIKFNPSINPTEMVKCYDEQFNS